METKPEYEKYIQEYSIKIQLCNALVDKKLLTSQDVEYVELRKAIETKDIMGHHNGRKNIFFREMEDMGNAWKIDWVANMYAYYKALPYHDEVIFMLDGERVVIPKKIYDIEGLNKKLQEQGLDPVLTNMLENLSLKNPV